LLPDGGVLNKAAVTPAMELALMIPSWAPVTTRFF